MSGTDLAERPDTGSTPLPRPARRRRRWLRAVSIAIASAITVVALFMVAGLPLYVFPAQDDVGKADVIIVIGPPTKDRVDLAHKMMKDGVAPRLIVIGYSGRKGEFTVSEMPVCREEAVTCTIPVPPTTKGEALILKRYAAAYDVHSAVVITAAFHVARARYIFDRCSGVNDISVVAVPSNLHTFGDWAHQYLYQSAAFVKAWVQPCADER